MQLQQQRESLSKHKALGGRRTVGEWVLLVVCVFWGIGARRALWRFFQHPPTNWYDGALVNFLIELAVIGTAVALLTHARRVAAFFQGLCALLSWCWIAIAVHGFLRSNGHIDAFAFFVCGLLFLIGLVHTLIARWLWRLAGMEKE